MSTAPPFPDIRCVGEGAAGDIGILQTWPVDWANKCKRKLLIESFTESHGQ